MKCPFCGKKFDPFTAKRIGSRRKPKLQCPECQEWIAV